MTVIAEQIVKGLLHHGIRVTVTAEGDLSLRGNTRELSDDYREAAIAHKAEVRRYATEQPLAPVAMYVASDLDHWTTDEPHIWGDTVTLFGKQYVRLTPATFAWFEAQVAKAKEACARRGITADAWKRIEESFAAVRAFAADTKVILPTAPREPKGTSGGLEV